jgi:hypothetical protein
MPARSHMSSSTSLMTMNDALDKHNNEETTNSTSKKSAAPQPCAVEPARHCVQRSISRQLVGNRKDQ